ncbi:enoyl-CoA hydratase/isomerase family protein [Nocardia sp. alder85J]|uniref:enoyl-CoA hydratase/isomerase family protein n=1 Tax=Nocardia sp. alder85J TaxID=2862949 RepID=UPI001CD628C4|nr:enoyl-CoA hydratase/isomerase family protein [Nocardia sp. alder85J]MCX4095609.1 enoyl-CoA hydratase/isomerase family protein [Nocardia sp. alder85J]
MTAPFETIVVSTEGAVGLIELNDPERMNPTDATTTLAEIDEALLAFGRDRTTRAVVLFGRGRAFSAGANLGVHRPARYPQDGQDSSPSRLAYGYAYGQIWETLHNFKKPLVAAVNGWCLGGGWELAHSCDLVIAGDSARFGAVEMNVGLIPFAGSAVYLPRMIGKHRAMDMILNARRIDAETALGLGLVNEVVPAAQTFERAKEVATELAQRPPIAVSFARELVKKAMAVDEFYDLERAYGYYLQTTEDYAVARAHAAQREPDAPAPQYQGK